MTTLELIKTFLTAYFAEGSPDKGLALVTDDIQCYGFADDEELAGMEALREMAESDVYAKFMDSELKIEKGNQVSEDSAVLNYSLSLHSVTIRGRIVGNSRQTPDGKRLYLLNNSMLNPLQTLYVYEDITRIKRAKLAKELLGNYISGGIMGGYMEPGFPFYFINDNMLRYLGYESEKEFTEHTQGLVENCIYGDDRKAVGQSVDEQIAATGAYGIDYRMLKKDGSYIWVHDVGKKVTAEDGRDAILSVCYDITSEKEHEHFLEGLIGSLNGDLRLFAVDMKQKCTIPVYASTNMGKKEGISKKGFLTRNTVTGMDSIYSGDRQRVWDAIYDAIQNNETPSISFRVFGKDGKVKWINASFARHGEQNGLPVILVLFTASTIQNDLLLHAISQNGNGIAVIDANTHEIYFANDAMFHMLGSEPFDYTNKICPDILAGCCGSCGKCVMRKIQKQEVLDTRVEFNGKWLSLHAERREWLGKPVVSIYATDVTEKFQLQKQLEDLFENLPSAVCLYRWDGSKFERLLIGKGFGALFGSGAKKLIDSSQDIIFEIVHPDDVQDLRIRVAAFLKGEGNSKGSYQYRAWNDDKHSYIWVSLHVNKVKQGDGTFLVYAVFINDTEQVALKNQLAATRTAINAAVQYGQFALWSYDLTNDSIVQNLADVGSYGYDSNQVFSTESFISQKVIHEEDAEAYLRCYQAIHDGAQHSECKVRVLNRIINEYRWMQLCLVRQPDVKHTHSMAVGISFDINREIEHLEEVSAAQRQLKQEKQVIDDLFENLPSGVVMYSWDGGKMHPIYVSKGFSDLYGEDGKAMLERTKGLDFDVVHPDDLPGLQAFIRNNINKTDQLFFYRYRVWNKQRKDYIWIQLTGRVKCQIEGTLLVYVNYVDVDAEVKAAEKIRREEELLETTCRLAHIWMFYYNLQDKRVRLSKVLQEDFQVPAIMENFPDVFLAYPVIPKEYHALYRQMVQKVDAGEDATTEMPVQLPDGIRRFVRFEWHITRKEGGKAVEVAGLPVDITKEVAERRRIEKERQKLLGGDKKLTAYSITDLQKERIVEAKGYYLSIGIQGGDTCEEFDAKVAPLLVTEEDRLRYLEMRDPRYAISQYEAGVTEWTEDMRWKNVRGQIRWQRSVYSIIENSNTGTLYLYCYLYDVMDEKITQSLFAGIQDNLYLKTGVLSFTTGQMYDYKGDYSNRRLRITDYNVIRNEYIAEDVLPEDAEMVLSQNKLENIKKQFDSGHKVLSFVHRARKNGMLCHHQVRFAMVPQRDDVCIAVVRDITDLVVEGERKNTELQKALTAANAATQAKSEFLSRMSHEIRTPMNAIMGMTAIAQDNKSDYLQVSDCLSKIDLSSKYLLTLINDILEMSRIESGKTKLSEDRFDFLELMEGIRTVAEPLAKKSEIRLEIINCAANGSYYGDSIRIQQVMVNLLGNAIKFTKRSGRVRFAVRAEEEVESKTTFEFTVEDTGIGMSEEFMKTMFEVFSQEDSTTTSQYGGSGLGLAISKSLVEAMDGTITAESMEGIGTNFTVRIPLKKAENTLLLKTEKITKAQQDAILKGKRILMAEDHPMNIMIAKKLLERKGIQIMVAENGKRAVDIFKNSAENEYDAVLMDIRMPLMDGLEASRQIRAMDRPDAATVPIIAMTANALEEDRKNSKAAGMNEHLAKPIEPKRMYQMLAEQLMRRTL